MIKLEYLASGSQQCPLIRLYDFDPSHLGVVANACTSLADAHLTEFALHSQPWVIVLGEGQLVLRAGRSNRGVLQHREGNSFVMEYNREGWLEVADKLRALALAGRGYQWLTNEGDVQVLATYDGEW